MVRKSESKLSFKFSGEEFVYAVNLAASVARKGIDTINFVVSSDKIRVVAFGEAECCEAVVSAEGTFTGDISAESALLKTVSNTEVKEFCFGIDSESWTRKPSELYEGVCEMIVESSKIRLVRPGKNDICFSLVNRAVEQNVKIFDVYHIPTSSDVLIDNKMLDKLFGFLQFFEHERVDGIITFTTNENKIVFDYDSKRMEVESGYGLVECSSAFDMRRIMKICSEVKGLAELDAKIRYLVANSNRYFIVSAKKLFPYLSVGNEIVERSVKVEFILAPVISL